MTVNNPGVVTAFDVGSGDSLTIVLGASWWVGVADASGNPLGSPPPCTDPIRDVSRVEIPVETGSLAIALDIPWNVVCTTPPSVSLTFITK